MKNNGMTTQIDGIAINTMKHRYNREKSSPGGPDPTRQGDGESPPVVDGESPYGC